MTERAVLDVQPDRLDGVLLPTGITAAQFVEHYPTVADLDTIVRINQWCDGGLCPPERR